MKSRVLVWIMADQLMLDHPALAVAEAAAGGRDGVRVVLVESRSWLRRLPYHRKRQVLYLSAGRHFVAELKAAGYHVDRIEADDSRAGLAQAIRKHKPGRLIALEAAEYPARIWQTASMASDLGLPVEVLPNTMFLVGRFNPIADPEPGKRYVMENFYRAIRRKFGLLIEPDGEPSGGKWNLDAENRKPLPIC